jgi:hypothetical protein
MKPYKRKPGEFEIRILPDGRVLIPAPDETLLDVARALNHPGAKKSSVNKARENERTKTRGAKKGAGPKRR